MEQHSNSNPSPNLPAQQQTGTSEDLNIPLNPEYLSAAMKDAGAEEKGRLLRALSADSCHLQPSVKAALMLAPDCHPGELIAFARSLGLSAANISQSGAKVLSLYKDPEKPRAVSLVVYSLLLEAAGSIKDEALRRRFTRERLPEKEMLEALAYAESPARLRCLRAVTRLAHIDSSVSQFCQQKLHNMLHFSGIGERATLLTEILSQPRSHLSRSQAETILHSSYDLDQLTRVINACGKSLLYEKGGARVIDFLARAAILNKTRHIALPGRLAPDAGSTEIEAALIKAEAAINAAGHAAMSANRYLKTAAAQHFRRLTSDRMSETRELRNSALPDEQKALQANTLLAALDFEFFYGIRLANESPSRVLTTTSWSSTDIEHAKAALARIPEGRLLMTPKLSTIQRVASLGQGVLGQRMPDGTVRIANTAANGHKGLTAGHGGYHSLETVLTHELGHSIQLGGREPTLEAGQSGFVVAPGVPDYNFKEFMGISAWQLITPGSWKPSNGGHSINLDGIDYPLEQPVRFGERWVLFTWNQGLLYSYDLTSGFSLNPYSRTNPWEDWAEGFCEYIMLPARLKHFAPEKFRFFEQEFRKYAADEQKVVPFSPLRPGGEPETGRAAA